MRALPSASDALHTPGDTLYDVQEACSGQCHHNTRNPQSELQEASPLQLVGEGKTIKLRYGSRDAEAC